VAEDDPDQCPHNDGAAFDGWIAVRSGASADNYTQEDAMTKAGLGDYTITQGQVSESILAESADGVFTAGEGPGFFVWGETAVADIELLAILE
jgi:hypothetical protein